LHGSNHVGEKDAAFGGVLLLEGMGMRRGAREKIGLGLECSEVAAAAA